MARPFVFFDGHVHLISPAGGGEHTLCGVANDAAISEGDKAIEWSETKKSIVDCETCASVIRKCRGVRVSQE